MNKLNNYFIGDIIRANDDVFEKAKAIMLLRFCFMFTVVFFLPIISDVLLGYTKATIVHFLGFISISFFPFVIKKQSNIDRSINSFFIVSFCVSLTVFMCINPTSFNIIGVCWSVFFIVLSALLQRGFARILFCCFLNWLPMVYIALNSYLNGALTIHWLEEKNAEHPPLVLILIPIGLLIYAVWNHSITIQHARVTMTEQKKIIDEKNKDITDSIQYAKRIQTALMTSEKYIDKTLTRMQNKENKN